MGAELRRVGHLPHRYGDAPPSFGIATMPQITTCPSPGFWGDGAKAGGSARHTGRRADRCSSAGCRKLSVYRATGLRGGMATALCRGTIWQAVSLAQLSMSCIPAAGRPCEHELSQAHLEIWSLFSARKGADGAIPCLSGTLK